MSGTRVEQRPDLGLAIAGPLHGFRVQPQRHVVDEHASVYLSQIDDSLTPVDERIERTDDVVAIDAKIESEVIARAGRDARIRQVVLGGQLGHDRLRAVAARRSQAVGAALHCVADELFEVVTEVQLDWLDTPAACLIGEVEPLGLAAARLGVVDEHGAGRRIGPGQIDVELERPRRRGDRGHEGHGHDQVHPRRPLHDDEDDRRDDQDHRRHQPEDPGAPTVSDAVPAAQRREHQTREHRQAAREPDNHEADGENQRDASQQHR